MAQSKRNGWQNQQQLKIMITLVVEFKHAGRKSSVPDEIYVTEEVASHRRKTRYVKPALNPERAPTFFSYASINWPHRNA